MRITDRIYLVGSGRTGFSLTDDYDCHVYAVDAGSEIVLIDAGGGRATEKILDVVRSDGLAPERISHLLLTHVHGDHAAGAKGLRDAIESLAGRPPTIYAHAIAAGWLRAGDETAISLDVARATEMYPPDFAFPACPVDRELDDDDTVEIGDLTFRAIASPGHSRGHLSYVVSINDRLQLFAGDALFFGGRVSLQNTWDCSIQETTSTIERLSALDWDGFYPGHLSFSVTDGHRHVDAAVRAVRRLGIPNPLVV